MESRSGRLDSHNNNQSVFEESLLVSVAPHEIITPFAPLKVKIADLQADGRLLSSDDVLRTIHFVEQKKKSKNLSGGKHAAKQKKDAAYAWRFKKDEMKSKFGMIVFGDQYFAIYRGVKQGCHLGVGGFGYAKLVQNIETGEWAVLKLSEAFKSGNQEFEVLQKVDMAIGQLDRIAGDNSEFIKAQRRLHPSYWMSNQNNLAMKLARGVSLADLGALDYPLTDQQLLQIITQLLQSYQHLADKNIIHGDIKLNNLFYDFVTNRVTIIDFGASARKQWLRGGAKRSLVVTEGYYAPELKHIEGKRQYLYTHASDIYALGMTIIYLLREGEDDLECERIADVATRNQILKFCRESMCHPDAGKRFNISDCIKFFENTLKMQLVLVPRPLCKIALLSLDEYRALLNEVKNAQIQQEKQRVAEVVVHTDTNAAIVPDYFDQFFKRVKVAFGHIFNLGAEVLESEQLDDPLVQPVMTHAERMQAVHATFMKTLGLFDEVWLMDSGHSTDKEYIEIRQQLEIAHVHVGSRCFVNQGLPLHRQISSVMYVVQSESQMGWRKFYCPVMRADQVLRDAYLPDSVLLLNITEESLLPSLSKAINEFAERDITDEYQFIVSELKSLVGFYNDDHSGNKSIAAEIISSVKFIEQSFAQHQLSYESLMTTLARLKTTVSVLDASPRSSARQQSSHHSIFSSKHRVVPESVQKVERIENQFKHWVKSYQ